MSQPNPPLGRDDGLAVWSRADVTKFMEEDVAFNRHLGIHIVSYAPGEVQLGLPYAPHLIGDPSRPALHGGVLSTLIDTCGGAAALSTVGVDQTLSTVDLMVDYLRPAPAADLVAKGTVARRGNRVCLADVTVCSAQDGAPVLAKGRAVYNIVTVRRDARERSPE